MTICDLISKGGNNICNRVTSVLIPQKFTIRPIKILYAKTNMSINNSNSDDNEHLLIAS